MEEWCSSTGGDTSVSKHVCITTTADTTTTTSTTTTTTTSPSSSSPSPCSNFSTTATMTKKYRGVRMRKWGKWVAEIREPNKRSRIWLGSYSSPVAAARAYDTAMFCLRGRAARLNFPDQLRPEDVHCDRTSASIRTKAIEVGARVDAAESSSSAADHHQHKTVVYSSSSTYKPDLNLEPNDDDDDNGFP